MVEDRKYCHKEAALAVPSAKTNFLSLCFRPQPLAETYTLKKKESQDLAVKIEMLLTRAMSSNNLDG